jgi:S1-C subfamily serine protease
MATLLRHARRLAASGAIIARASTPASEGAAASLAASTATAAHRRFVMTSRRAHATAGAAVAADDEHLLQSVVKVFTVHSSPNYFQPWQNKPQRETSGSGVVVTAPVPGGVGILTNAHVVADQTFVQVRRHGSSVKHRARVHAVGHACDLAVLAVDDRSFWAEGADTPHPPTPLSLGDVPHLQDQVTVVGFPQGGDNLSITSGVVSRIELTNYAHGAAQLLAIQLDAAINPGNSGGPALGSDGSVVGLAFQNLANADNIGYVIPTPIIRRFLEDVEDDWKTAATHMPTAADQARAELRARRGEGGGEGYSPRGVLLARDQVPAHG